MGITIFKIFILTGISSDIGENGVSGHLGQVVTFTHIVKIYRRSCLPSFFIVYVTKIDDVTACFLVLSSRRIFGERVYYNYLEYLSG